MAKKARVRFGCQSCGYVSPKYLDRCPSCGQRSSMVEEVIQDTSDCHARVNLTGKKTQPQQLSRVIPRKESRIKAELVKLNRVLGGGVVPGLLVLIGGDPGIGESALLLQVSQQLTATGGTALYVSGEENAEQIKLRAERLDIINETFYLYTEADMHKISRAIEKLEPDCVIIDSIQTMTQPGITSVAGSVDQVRETVAELLKLAKTSGTVVFIVGHVTKGGSIVGPRMLEHMVDAVLYFEEDRHHTFRILRTIKNQLGSTNEIGILEIQTYGLVEVMNPSQVFLEERLEGTTESSIVVAMEGSCPILIEIQALVTPAMFGNAKRTTTRLDFSRVSLIMTALEKRTSFLLQNQGTYLKATGGVKTNKPAIDLVLAISIASSYKEKGTSSSEYFIGEIGLIGEIHRMNSIKQRVHEVQRLGLTKVCVPKNNLGGWKAPEGIEVISVSTIGETLRRVFK